jgi:hypothetical protein
MNEEVKYEPISAGFGPEDKKIVLEISPDEDDMHMYQTDFPDPEEVREYQQGYNGRALAPLREWIAKRVADSDKIVQYDEVIVELDKFSPKYCCDIDFCRGTLLPNLEGELPNLPASLIAVLYTLHLVHSDGTRLISAEKDGKDILFEAEFDSRIDGKIVSNACKYILINYLSPMECDLRW